MPFINDYQNRIVYECLYMCVRVNVHVHVHVHVHVMWCVCVLVCLCVLSRATTHRFVHLPDQHLHAKYDLIHPGQ